MTLTEFAKRIRLAPPELVVFCLDDGHGIFGLNNLGLGRAVNTNMRAGFTPCETRKGKNLNSRTAPRRH